MIRQRLRDWFLKLPSEFNTPRAYKQYDPSLKEVLVGFPFGLLFVLFIIGLFVGGVCLVVYFEHFLKIIATLMFLGVAAAILVYFFGCIGTRLLYDLQDTVNKLSTKPKRITTTDV